MSRKRVTTGYFRLQRFADTRLHGYIQLCGDLFVSQLMRYRTTTNPSSKESDQSKLIRPRVTKRLRDHGTTGMVTKSVCFALVWLWFQVGLFRQADDFCFHCWWYWMKSWGKTEKAVKWVPRGWMGGQITISASQIFRAFLRFSQVTVSWFV